MTLPVTLVAYTNGRIFFSAPVLVRLKRPRTQFIHL